MNGTTIASTANLPYVSSGWCAAGADDYNGDGQVDLLWYNQNTGQVAVWLMNGSKILQSAIIATVPLSWYPIAGAGACSGN
jgi:hypothetical protein